MNEKKSFNRTGARIGGIAVLGIWVGFIVLSGCGSADPESSEPAGAQPEAATVERTIVRIGVDGTMTSTREVITEAEQRDEMALREYLRDPGSHAERACEPPECCTAICADSGCAGSDLWVYDAAGETGNELCLYNANTADIATVPLSDFADGSGTWSEKVRSYWPGVSPGFFGDTTTLYCPDTCNEFSSYGAATNASSCEGGASYLTLNGNCNPG
jgi:hypothetical protein